MAAEILAGYGRRITRYENALKSLRRISNYVTFGRLAIFIAGIVLLVTLIPVHYLVAVGAFLLSFIILLVLVRYSVGLGKQKQMLENLIRINREEVLALEENFDHFYPGKEFIDPGHPNSSDLDPSERIPCTST